jgi:hypothetical protein
MWMPPEIRPPTPAEYAVAAGLISGSLIVFGMVGLVFVFRAPPEKHELALALEHYSAWSLGIGAAIALISWLVRKLTD